MATKYQMQRKKDSAGNMEVLHPETDTEVIYHNEEKLSDFLETLATKDDVNTGSSNSVSGASSSTDNAIARFDGTGGKTIQNSKVTIDDSGNMVFPNGATLKLDLYGTRSLTLNGNSILADMSEVSGGWAGAFASVKHKDSTSTATDGTTTTTMLGWYGGATDLTHIFMGGTYNNPYMKMVKAGDFTFYKNLTINTGATLQFNKLKLPTASNGTTYGLGANGQLLKSNGATVYWADNDASTIEIDGLSLDWNKATNVKDAIINNANKIEEIASSSSSSVEELQSNLVSGAIEVGKATSATNANSATKATYDSDNNKISTTYAKKTEIPEKVSELENDSKYVTEEQLTGLQDDIVDGTLVVGYAQQATYDKNMNDIAEYYATKDEVANVGQFKDYEVDSENHQIANRASSDANGDVITSTYAKKENGIYYVEGTGTTDGVWKGELEWLTKYFDGLTIAYKINVKGASTTTLQIGNLAPITVRLGTGNLTTHYPVDTIIYLTYTTINETGYWVTTDYDSTNTYQLRKYYGGHTASTAIYRYQLLLTQKDSKVLPINVVNNAPTNTSKTLTTLSFDPFGAIYFYNYTSTISAGGTPSTSYLYKQVLADLRYSFNTGSTLTANKPVYMVCVLQSDGLFKLNGNSCITQSLPTSADTKYYIYLGQAHDTYRIELSLEHPIYYYDGTKIGLYTGIKETNIPKLNASSNSFTGTLNAGNGEVSLSSDGISVGGNDEIVISRDGITIDGNNVLTSADMSSYALKTDLNSYLTTTNASSTYLTKTSASSTYLAKTDASSTYLTKTDASNTYALADDIPDVSNFVELSGTTTVNYVPIFTSSGAIQKSNLKVDSTGNVEVYADKYLKTNKLNLPKTNGNSTYTLGTAGQIPMSNGTTVYWSDIISTLVTKEELEAVGVFYAFYTDDNNNQVAQYADVSNNIKITNQNEYASKMVLAGTYSETSLEIKRGYSEIGYVDTIYMMPASGILCATTFREDGYNLNDKYVLQKDNPQNIYFVIGNTTGTAGIWTGSNSKITEYFDGMVINYKIGIAGASSGTTTLNINGLGAKNVYLRGTTALTTNYPVGTMVLLSYNKSKLAFYSADYDANSYAYVRQYTTTTNAEYPMLFAYETTIPSTYDTKYTRKATGFTFNPSTGTLSVTKLKLNGTEVDLSKYALASSLSGYATTTQLQGFQQDLENGVIVPYESERATKDASGNTITSTYVTNTALSQFQSALETGSVIVEEANYASDAGSATIATKATQDASGNVITSTYAKETRIPNFYTTTSALPAQGSNTTLAKTALSAMTSLNNATLKVGDLVFSSYYTSSYANLRIGTVYSITGSNVTIRTIYSSTGKFTCLAEGTMISMADGTKKKIEDVKEGELLKSVNLENGQTINSVCLFSQMTTVDTHLYYLMFENGKRLKINWTHDIYNATKKTWVKSDCELDVGDMVLDENGNEVMFIGPVDWVTTQGSKQVKFYNIISSSNCYYADGILMANNPITQAYWLEGKNDVPIELINLVSSYRDETNIETDLMENEQYFEEHMKYIGHIMKNKCRMGLLKNKLSQTDYVAIKQSEGEIIDNQIIVDRASWRQEYNEIEVLQKHLQDLDNKIKAKYSTLGEDVLLPPMELRAKLFEQSCKLGIENFEKFKKYYENSDNYKGTY